MARIEARSKKVSVGDASTGTTSIPDAALRHVEKKVVAVAEFDLDGALRRADGNFLKILAASSGAPGSNVTLEAAMRSISAQPVMNAEGLQVGIAIQWLDRPQDTLTETQVDALLGDAPDEGTDEIENQSTRMARYAVVEAARDGGCESPEDQARA